MVPQQFEPPHEALTAALRDFFLRSQRVLDRAMSAHGATLAQAKLLHAIHGGGATRSTELATLFGLSPRTVTEAVDGLERAGLLLRVPDPADRRAKTLLLTPAGIAAAIATDEIRRAFTADLFSALTPAERDALRQLLGKLGERLDAL